MKKYTIGVKSPNSWKKIHNLLCCDSNCEHIPNRRVTCCDEKIHSPTRGIFELDDDEVDELRNHPDISWIELSSEYYPEKYPQPITFAQRWPSDVKIYRTNFIDRPPAVATSAEENRSNWGVKRVGIVTNSLLWNNSTANAPFQNGFTHTEITSNVEYTLTGKNVDIIIQDAGILQYHPEFIDSNGKSRVRDIFLDGPYYIDPDYFNNDTEYNNGPIINVVGNGSDFFKREVTTNGVRIMGAGTVGGQTAVPDAWLEKVARMVELFTDVNGAGINETSQRNLIKTLSGDAGTYHAGYPTIQRVARGSGAEYTPNFLTDQGIIDWNLTNLYDTTVQNDMVWYLNSSGVGYGDGDTDAQEVIEHVFHTLHMHGLPADTIKLYEQISSDWQSGDLYAAMEEAYDAGKWDPSGYNSPSNAWKTDAEAFEVAAKEYLYLLNFCMFEYTSLWEGGSLAPEWTDDMRTQAGIQANNPLGYAFHNTYIAPAISKPSLATIRSIFQDGNTPAQDDPSLAGVSGYVVDIGLTYTKPDGRVGIATTSARDWWENSTRRSSQFASAGTVFGVPPNYTAENVLGVSLNGNTAGLTDAHGTAAASLAAGKNFGLAFEANIWNMYGISQNQAVNIPIETQYDLMKIFHLNKPVNTEISRKNPTIINGSWGYFSFFTTTQTVNYKFRGSTGSFTGSDSNVNSQVLNYKDGLFAAGFNGEYKWSSSSRSLSTDEAGRELMNAGVIYVASAGNNDLRLGVSLTDPDRGNYFTDGFGFTDFTTDSNGNRIFPNGTVPIGHVQYQHPVGIGFDEPSGFAPVVCVGAMDDLTVLQDGVTERKARYSNSGPGIDVWAPADDTLSAGFNLPANTYLTYPRYNDANFIDVSFNGTSAASPVTAGLLALRLEESPSDTSWQIKNWLENHGSVLFSPSDIRFSDPVTDDTTPQYYSGQYNLSGAEKRILFNPYETTTVTPPIPPNPPTEEPPPPTPEPPPPAPEPPPTLPDIVDSNDVVLILEGNELAFEGVSIFGDS
jgi:hypothetical protein